MREVVNCGAPPHPHPKHTAVDYHRRHRVAALVPQLVGCGRPRVYAITARFTRATSPPVATTKLPLWWRWQPRGQRPPPPAMLGRVVGRQAEGGRAGSGFSVHAAARKLRLVRWETRGGTLMGGVQLQMKLAMGVRYWVAAGVRWRRYSCRVCLREFSVQALQSHRVRVLCRLSWGWNGRGRRGGW